jgi:transcriptional regulator with XRE-family HTH domain
MLRMEQTQLAERAGVSVETVKRLEGGQGLLKAQYETLSNIRKAFEFAGVDFIDGHWPGVRLTEDRTAAFVKAMTDEFAGSFRACLETTVRRNPALVEGPKKQLIKAVLEDVAAILKHTLPHRLPGKD